MIRLIERLFDEIHERIPGLAPGGAGTIAGYLIGIPIVIIAILIGHAAHAAPYTLKFQNPSPTQAYTQLRTPWGIVAAPCAPGATCSVIIDAPIGQQTITAEATSDGALWSGKSNALSARIFPLPADCLALPACRFDPDGNGQVTVGDFGAFLSAMGSSW